MKENIKEVNTCNGTDDILIPGPFAFISNPKKFYIFHSDFISFSINNLTLNLSNKKDFF